MTFSEFERLADAIKTFFPREKLLVNHEAVELWFRQLSDLPYNVASAAVAKYAATSKWSPTIADIREMAAGITYGEAPDWGEAWAKVSAAIRLFGYYREADALKNLDDLTRRTVNRLGYKSLCMSENPETDRANFRMIYEQLSAREKAERQMSENMRKRLAAMSPKREELPDLSAPVIMIEGRDYEYAAEDSEAAEPDIEQWRLTVANMKRRAGND